MSPIKFQCLQCGEILSSQNSKIICKNCGSYWPVINDVPHFIKAAPYWGEVSQKNMRLILQQMKTKYWKDIFEESELQEVREAYSMIGNLRKANWHLLLDLPKNSLILDIGAGSGVLSEALSHCFAHIVSVEPVIERIDFMKMRFQQEHRDNITLVRGDALNLPFPESSFDLIVMSGVLEWVPLSDENADPQSVQMAVLKKIYAALKPGGILAIGIENRMYPYYFLGKEDPHFYLSFVTILPRRLANIYSKKKTGQQYRNYLYSSKGYEKLLRTCGFSKVDIYTAYPSYNYPHELIPLKRNIYSFFTEYLSPCPINWKRKVLSKVLHMLGLLQYCDYAYMIFGGKK